MDSKRGRRLDSPYIGHRVWSDYGLREHGRNPVNVPAQAGGVIIRISNEYAVIENLLYHVRWDGDQESVHYIGDFSRKLQCIGSSKTPQEFKLKIITEAERIKKTIYEDDGFVCGMKVFFPGGDWVPADAEVLKAIESKNLPVQTEHIPRPPKRTRKSPVVRRGLEP